MEITRFLKGGLNTDDSPEFMDENDYSYLQNVSTISPGGEGNVIEASMGMSAWNDAGLIVSTHTCIGGLNFRGQGKAFLFYYSSIGNHMILMLSGSTVTNVINWSGLNWSATTRINGGALANDILYFTDQENDLWAIHTTRYTSSTSGLVIEDITLIKRGPQYPITTAKGSDATDVDIIGQYDYQFAYQYVYTDNQASVLSPYSKLVPQNDTNESYNKITLTIPTADSGSDNESLPNNIKQINVCSRIGNTGTWYVVDILKSPSSGSNKTVVFYGNVNGIAVESHYEYAFEPIPNVATTMTMLKNKLLIGNYTEGYDSPSIALSGSVTEDTSAPEIITTVFNIDKETYIAVSPPAWPGTPDSTEDLGYFIKDGNNLYYKLTGYSSPGGAGPYEIAEDGRAFNQSISPSFSTNVDDIGIAHVITVDATDQDIDITGYYHLDDTYTGTNSAARNSSYKLGILFSDKYGRKCTVHTNSNCILNTSKNEEAKSITLDWSLADHVNIPDWAFSYTVVCSKNLKKPWFVSGHTSHIIYSKIDAEGTKTFNLDYDLSNNYIEIDIRGFIESGGGYDYKNGDRIVISNLNGSDYDLKIIGIDGTRLYCEYDLSLITLPAYGGQYLFEIYTPAPQNFDILFYEQGETYPITDPGGTPTFSTTSGTIGGDVVSIIRSTFIYSSFDLTTGEGVLESGGSQIYQSMSYQTDVDDIVQWNTSIGRGFAESTIGQKNKPNYFRISQLYIADTEITGLNEFDVDEDYHTPLENGDLQKLQPTSKQQQEGNVVLAIGRSNTASIYIDETSLNIANETSFLVSSDETVGAVRSSNKGYGTVNPESVFEYRGHVFWWDKDSACFVRYASNGIFPISSYKAQTYFKKQADQQGASDLVISGIDPYLNRLFVTFETADTTEKKTISFDLDQDRWKSYHSFTGLYYFDMNNTLNNAGETGDDVYAHNDDTNYCTFFGVEKDIVLDISFNDRPDILKEFSALQLKTSTDLYNWSSGNNNVDTDAISVSISNVDGQASDLVYSDFEVSEYLAYAPFFKDTTSSDGKSAPAWVTSTAYVIGNIVTESATKYICLLAHTSGTFVTDLAADKWVLLSTYDRLNGEDLVSGALRLSITIKPSGSPSRLYFAKVGFEISQGHLL